MATVRRTQGNARRIKGVTILAGVALLLGIGEGSRQYYRFQQQRTVGDVMVYPNALSKVCITERVEFDPKKEHIHPFDAKCVADCTAGGCDAKHYAVVYTLEDPDGIARIIFYDGPHELGEIVMATPASAFTNFAGLHGKPTRIAVEDCKGRKEYFTPSNGWGESVFWSCDAPHNGHVR